MRTSLGPRALACPTHSLGPDTHKRAIQLPCRPAGYQNLGSFSFQSMVISQKTSC